MLVYENLYGQFKLEPVLKELIDTKPVQRLKKVHQAGACFLINPTWNVTRFEHSMGVMLLIRKMGGSLEEQIAGLLHDVGHTAFSHVIDYVLHNEEENYHDTITNELILSSEIPDILYKYGFSVKTILDTNNWSILEQELPHLCADRIDYTLRDMHRYQNISIEEIRSFLNHLSMHHHEIVISSIEWAEWFTELYYREVVEFFLHPANVYANQQLAYTLKIAMEREILNMNDFLFNDFELLKKLKASNDQEVIKHLSMCYETNFQTVSQGEPYDFKAVVKPRLIDPKVWYEGRVVRATEISNKVRNMSEQAINRMKRGTYVKYLGNL